MIEICAPLRPSSAWSSEAARPPRGRYRRGIQVARFNLTAEQRAVVTAPEGPLLVLAGPGTGKTAVLTDRIAHLIGEHGIVPASILALAFSNRAAQELRLRLAALLGADGRAVDVATLHGFGLRLLRQWQAMLGYASTPLRVYDERAALALLAQTLGGTGVAVGPLPLRALRRALDRHRLALTGGAHAVTLQAIAAAYETQLRRRGAVDYPAMLLEPLRLLRKHPEVARLLRVAYRAVLLDEAQDTCAVQYALVRQLAERHRHLVLVGDPAQSLFAWRGADGSVMRTFLRDFPETTVRTLSQNFRSTPQIVAVANTIGAGLPSRLALQAVGPSGPATVVHRAADEADEAAYIAGEVIHLLARGLIRNASEVAVLIRANAQAPPLAGELRARGLFGGPSIERMPEHPAAGDDLPDDLEQHSTGVTGATARRSVSLLTIHAAKGLEWPAVFVAGLEEGLLPHRRAFDSGETVDALVAERRAAYVAVTRPRWRLYLTCSRARLRGGVSIPSQASRFLEDLAGLPLTRTP